MIDGIMTVALYQKVLQEISSPLVQEVLVTVIQSTAARPHPNDSEMKLNQVFQWPSQRY